MISSRWKERWRRKIVFYRPTDVVRHVIEPTPPQMPIILFRVSKRYPSTQNRTKLNIAEKHRLAFVHAVLAGILSFLLRRQLQQQNPSHRSSRRVLFVRVRSVPFKKTILLPPWPNDKVLLQRRRQWNRLFIIHLRHPWSVWIFG